MRSLCSLVLMVMAVIALPSQSHANQCGFIKNSDKRNFCEAKARKNMALCGAIKDNDLRQLCNALLRNNKAFCGMIKDRDKRYDCLSNF
jgi:hypothetical protein